MLPFLSGRGRPQGHPLLDELRGQSIIHTRVAARGTWTVTARGWALHSRIQHLAEEAVGLRDARLLGAIIDGAQILPGGQLDLVLANPFRAGTGAAPGPAGTRPPALHLTTGAPWSLSGPRGARLAADTKGELTAEPPGAPRFATEQALADHRGSRPSGIELQLMQLAQGQWLHPGHVVEALGAAGALEDEEFERRGPILLARMLAREELRAGFVVEDRFTPWTLSLAEVVEHIGATWAAIDGRTPGRDMIAWFELTDTGRDTVGTTGTRVLPPGMSGYDSPGVVGGFR